MNDSARDELARKRAQQAVAQEHEAEPSDVEVTVLDDAKVPGLVVFRARLVSEHGRRGSYDVGVLSKDGAELDGEKAIEMVLHALRGEHGKHAPDPVQVAKVVGFLEGDTEPTHPILSAEDMAGLSATWKPHVYLPRATTVDGTPAIEYWVKGHGLHRTQILLKPDGTNDLSVKSIGQFLP